MWLISAFTSSQNYHFLLIKATRAQSRHWLWDADAERVRKFLRVYSRRLKQSSKQSQNKRAIPRFVQVRYGYVFLRNGNSSIEIAEKPQPIISEGLKMTLWFFQNISSLLQVFGVHTLFSWFTHSRSQVWFPATILQRHSTTKRQGIKRASAKCYHDWVVSLSPLPV